MSIISSESGKINQYIFEQDNPKTYFNLIEKVGSTGKYQKRVLTVFTFIWFISGVILLSNSFLFRNRLYDCDYYGLLLQDVECMKYVCSLPEQQWSDYFDPQNNDFQNIATLNNYQCQDSLIIIVVRACTYMGACLGFLCISFLMDNFGRKSSIILSWLICIIGNLMIALGLNIPATAIGLFLSGFGSDAVINITFIYFCEMVENTTRQKYSIIMQLFFVIGAIVATTFFYVISNWRVVWYILVVIPSVIALFFIFLYIKQTPRFLVKRGIKHALKQINHIGRLNLQRRQTLQQQDIQSVRSAQLIEQFRNIKITHLDLYRFPSLTATTVNCSLIAFVIYGMYYGPALILQNIGFNFYATSYILFCSELLIYIPIYLYIQRIKRKQMGYIFITIAICSSFFLVIFDDPTECGICLDGPISITMIIIFRAAVSFFFAFFEIYVCELFPSRVRGLSFGIISAVGSLSSTLTPILLNVFIDQEINATIIFLLTGVLAMGCLNLLPQTVGKPLKQQIEQVEHYKYSKFPELKIQKKISKSLIHTSRPHRSSRTYRSQFN